MISEQSAQSTPLLVGFRTWLWHYICFLLLISMLWHRQAIFESKEDKLSSSAEAGFESRVLYTNTNVNANTHTNTNTNTHTHNRQAYRQTYNRQTCRQTYRQMYRQTDVHNVLFSIQMELSGLLETVSTVRWVTMVRNPSPCSTQWKLCLPSSAWQWHTIILWCSLAMAR